MLNKVKFDKSDLILFTVYFVCTVIFFYASMNKFVLEIFKKPIFYIGINTLINMFSTFINLIILNIFLKLSYKLVKKNNLNNSISIALKIVLSLQLVHLILQCIGLANITLPILLIAIVFNPVLHSINYLIWKRNNCNSAATIICVSVPFYIYLVLDFLSLYR